MWPAMAGEPRPGVVSRIADAFGLVLLLVLATYVTASLTRYSGWGAVAIVALGATSAVLALVTSSANAKIVRVGAVAGAACLALALIAELTDRAGFLGAAALLQFVLMIAATASVLRAVISESRVTFRTILGAISVYLIFGLLFTSLYVGLDRVQDGPFFAGGGGTETGDYVFFSFTTLTTTGYGNLVPGEQPGKMFSGLEMLLGQIFLVTLIAGLVSAWRPRHRSS
jgi:hypothetical protein